jgi:hypothetical protein
LNADAGGAYVCILGLAHAESHFPEIASAEMDTLGLLALEFQDVEAFDPATETWNDDELCELTTELSHETPVRYRTFHNYPREDLDA